MNYLDTLFRGFTDYRKSTTESRECERQREIISKADVASDRIEITKTRCIIEEDWINEIEKGLVYVEKAIREERQFIRSNGEVVPIEKAKRVSKDSVEHLARHSNLLTKMPEGEDIIPDQIYTVERLSDYAVYENRFLYMLLCYLRDFISLRYNKILELTNTYNGTMSMNKAIVTRSRKLNYKVSLIEEKKDDEYLKANNEAKDIIGRIDLILKTVMLFLSTPLMDEVSKTPILKPPITKTNVLKMNHNFKNAVALYDYVTSYGKDGYSVERTVKVFNAFSDEMADEFAEVATLSSFLTYEYGLGIKSYLKEAYDEEEKRIKEERNFEFLEQIKKLKRRIKESGESPEEYMLMLEKRNRMLEDDSVQLAITKKEVELLKEEKLELGKSINALNQIIEEKNQEIHNIKHKHEEDIAALKMAHQQEIEQIKIDQEEKIAIIKSIHNEEIVKLKELHEKEVKALNSQIQKQKNDADELLKSVNEKHEKEIKTLNNELLTSIDQLNKNKIENVKLVEEKLLAMARLNALRKQNGLLHDPNEFTSQAAFNEIELEYNAFKKFFKGEWKNAKKQIRKDVFSKQKLESVVSDAQAPNDKNNSKGLDDTFGE